MKLAKIVLSLAVIGTLGSVMADTTNINSTVTIDQQISKIQKAPVQERVELMNQLKQRIMQMNAEQRQAAISQLQASMGQANHHVENGINKAHSEVSSYHEGTHENINQMQMTATTQMEHSQQMNHQRTGDQHNHMQDHSTYNSGMLGQQDYQEHQSQEHQNQQHR